MRSFQRLLRLSRRRLSVKHGFEWEQTFTWVSFHTYQQLEVHEARREFVTPVDDRYVVFRKVSMEFHGCG